MIYKNVLIIKNGKCKTYIENIIKLININTNVNIIHCSKIKSINYSPDYVIILGGITSVREI